LRNNGGGSLQTVVDMGGLFIEEGPVAQVKQLEKQKFK
jgi:carboxyl-terminal processing protease